MVNAWVGLAGIVGTLAAAVGAVWFTQRAENRRWYAQQLHLADVARADRLRGVYGQLAQAAVSLRGVIGERAIIQEGETRDQRDERHQRELRRALAKVGEIGGLVLVESSAESVRNAYTSVAVATDHFMRGESHLPPGADRQNRLTELAEVVMHQTEQVMRLARDHLEKLERPVPVGAEAVTRANAEPRSATSDDEG